MKRPQSFLVSILALLLALAHTCRGQECPVPHECQGFGLEELSSGTGEAAFCLAQGATPICPGIDMDGNPITITTTTNAPPDTVPPTTTNAPPDTVPPTTTNAPPDTVPPTTTNAPPDTVPPTTTNAPPDTVPPTTTTPPDTTTQVCEVASCKDKSEGVYPHPDCDCQRYYACRRAVLGSGLAIEQYRCTGNKVYDQDTYKCVSDSSKCPYAR